VVRRPAEVGDDVPAEQPHRAVQVDGHVTAADPIGEVGGEPPPQIITVMIIASPSQAYVIASVTS
jgi:hypothetical protein